jgi:hypothetical protein
MHPDFRSMALHDHRRALDERLRAAFLSRAPEPAEPAPETVVLRLCTVRDDAALERLAQLEGRPAPRGRFVVAEVDGAVAAARPLLGGAPLADPFRPTAHLLPLLELRAAQLEQPERSGRRLLAWGAARGTSRA